MRTIVRTATAGDLAAIDVVVGAAFGGPVEVALVRLLRGSPAWVPDLELVAERDGTVVGHVMLSHATLEDRGTAREVLSLAPLAVAPSAQRSGVGKALVAEALRRAGARGEPLVLVEGSPDYYGPLGFEDARTHGITFPLPDWAPPGAGQVKLLGASDDALRGRVVYPEAFRLAEEMGS